MSENRQASFLAERHERGLAEQFIRAQRQPRFLALLGSPKGRRKLRAALDHFDWLNPAHTTRVPGSASADGVVRMLYALGAPKTCYVISEADEVDAQMLPLADIVKEVFGSGLGTLISCIPGRLGYYEGEDIGRRFVLSRDAM